MIPIGFEYISIQAVFNCHYWKIKIDPRSSNAPLLKSILQLFYSLCFVESIFFSKLCGNELNEKDSINSQ